jgi:hypothetical protein
MQTLVIAFFSCFLLVLPFLPPIHVKPDFHNIAKHIIKVALNTNKPSESNHLSIDFTTRYVYRTIFFIFQEHNFFLLLLNYPY